MNWENFMTAEEYREVRSKIKEILELEKKIRELKLRKLRLNIELMKYTAFRRLSSEYRKQLWAEIRKEVGLL